MTYRPRASCALIVCAALSACQGTIESGDALAPGADDPGGSATGSPSSGGPGTVPGGGDPNDPRIAQRIWRLSPTQFNDEVKRLFGAGAPLVKIPETAAEDGLTNIAANAVVDLGNASVFVDGARSIATWVVMQKGATTRCTNYGSEACVDSLLAWLPAAAFRRSVTQAEKAELRGLYDDLRDTYDYDYAFSGVVRAVLLSPDFLYRSELGDERAVLTQNEIANLLAFAITDQSPDDALLQAAEQGDLTSPDQREAQARRLMARSAIQLAALLLGVAADGDAR